MSLQELEAWLEGDGEQQNAGQRRLLLIRRSQEARRRET